MVLPRSLRKTLASISFGLGFVWGVAGAFKLVFGVRMTLVFLPPLDLERVAAVPAVVVALGLFALGAWLARTGTGDRGAIGAGGEQGLLSSVDPMVATERRDMAAVRDRRPSAP
jgi:hypothetical protein